MATRSAPRGTTCEPAIARVAGPSSIALDRQIAADPHDAYAAFCSVAFRPWLIAESLYIAYTATMLDNFERAHDRLAR